MIYFSSYKITLKNLERGNFGLLIKYMYINDQLFQFYCDIEKRIRTEQIIILKASSQKQYQVPLEGTYFLRRRYNEGTMKVH